MRFVSHFICIVSHFVGSKAKRHTLVELAEAAETDEFDQVLARAGVLSGTADAQPLERRKWSQIERFNRADFDINAYTKSLRKK